MLDITQVSPFRAQRSQAGATLRETHRPTAIERLGYGVTIAPKKPAVGKIKRQLDE
jgi:hypothetical protein